MHPLRLFRPLSSRHIVVLTSTLFCLLTAASAESTINDVGQVFVSDGTLVIGGTEDGARIHTGSPDTPYTGLVIANGFATVALPNPSVPTSPVTASLTMTGAGATLDVAGPGGLNGLTTIGYNGTGRMDISAGAMFAPTGPSAAVIALGGPAVQAGATPLPHSTGTVTVTGKRSHWTAGTLRVGHAGVGILKISDGATVNTNGNLAPGFGFVAPTILGTFSGASGNVTVTGPGSALTVVDRLGVADGNPTRGNFGPAIGILDVLNGALVRSWGGAVGNYGPARGAVSAIGTATLDGPGSRWELLGPAPAGFTRNPLDIGRSGIGTVSITNEAQLLLDGGPGGNLGALLSVGLQPGSNGTLTVSGASSRLDVRGPSNRALTEASFASDDVLVSRAVMMNVGFNGKGRFEVFDGARASISGIDVVTGQAQGFLNIGRNAGSTGSVLVTGRGSELTVGVQRPRRVPRDPPSIIGIGRAVDLPTGPIPPGGEGLLALADGGTVRAQEIHLGPGGTLTGNGTVIADIVNFGGTLVPGELRILGDYRQVSGRLDLNVDGRQHDVLKISGGLALDPQGSSVQIVVTREPVPEGTVLELVRSGAGDVLSIEFSRTAVVPRGSGVFEALLRDNPRVVRIDTVREPSTLVLLGLDPPWRR